MIYTSIENRKTLLQDILPKNPGLIIIKFTATWCNPCKIIKDIVYENFNNAPENVMCFDVDIDQNFDVFAFLKSKKMVSGIPAILVWQQGNESYVPDDAISGGDPVAVNDFLQQHFSEIKA